MGGRKVFPLLELINPPLQIPWEELDESDVLEVNEWEVPKSLFLALSKRIDLDKLSIGTSGLKSLNHGRVTGKHQHLIGS